MSGQVSPAQQAGETAPDPTEQEGCPGQMERLHACISLAGMSAKESDGGHPQMWTQDPMSVT